MIEGKFNKLEGKVEWLGQWYKFKGKTFVDITKTGMTQLNTLNDAIEWAAKDGIPVLYTNAGLFNGVKDDANGLKTKISSKVHLFVASYTTSTKPQLPMYFEDESWRFWEYTPGQYRFKFDTMREFEQYFIKSSAPGEPEPPEEPDNDGDLIVDTGPVLKAIHIPAIDITFEYYDE